jgi:hypothetical protein
MAKKINISEKLGAELLELLSEFSQLIGEDRDYTDQAIRIDGASLKLFNKLMGFPKGTL